MPVWDGELYLEYHRGTYTGQARQKLRNALSELLYHAAELYAATARALLDAEYPRHCLEEGWRLILTNQFHDILPGSAISSVYVDAEADYQQLAQIGSEVLDSATTRVAGAIGLERDALVVFNPAPFPSSEYLELPPNAISGVALPSQPTSDGGVLVWCGGVPANGYEAFSVGTSPLEEEVTTVLRVSNGRVETPYWIIELNDRGCITRLYDQQVGREVVPDGQLANRLVVFEDKPLNYDAWDIDAYYTAKSFEVGTLETVHVRESGPERAVLAMTWRIGEGSRVSQRMCVYARSRRIDFVTDVEWQEHQALLKVAFPTDIRNRRATYEIQFGTIDRPTHRNTSWEEAAFEVPAQRWADLSDSHYGVAVLADCKHGYSVQESTLWLSLLKGAIDPDPDADRGQHHFTYSLLPHPAGLAAVRHAAYGLSRPLLWRREAAHPGRLPTRFSLANVADSDVVVETAKWAEDEDALIVRLYEAAGGSSSVSLDLGVTADAVEQVDLLERNPRALDPTENGAVPLDFHAREIKTVLVRRPTPNM